MSALLFDRAIEPTGVGRVDIGEIKCSVSRHGICSERRPCGSWRKVVHSRLNGVVDSGRPRNPQLELSSGERRKEIQARPSTTWGNSSAVDCAIGKPIESTGPIRQDLRKTSRCKEFIS